MTERILTGCLLLVALIHLMPTIGVMSAGKLISLYEVDINNANLELLMRHRAVLFGLLGSFIAYAAFHPHLHALALIAGFASVLSFLYLSYSIGTLNSAMQKVVVADLVALLALIIAAIIYLLRETS